MIFADLEEAYDCMVCAEKEECGRITHKIGLGYARWLNNYHQNTAKTNAKLRCESWSPPRLGTTKPIAIHHYNGYYIRRCRQRDTLSNVLGK